MIISSTQNVFLDVGILSGPRSVFHPNSDAEFLREGRIEGLGRHDRCRVCSVEFENLVGLSALVAGQGRGPGGGRSGGRQQVDAVARRAAELSLASHAVGVAVAALPYVIGRQGEGRSDITQDARRVAELQLGGGKKRLGTYAGGVVDSFRYAAPAWRANPVHLDGHHRRSRLLHSAVVGDDAEDVVVGTLVVQRLGVSYGALVVDDERLISRQDLVLANVAEFRRAVPIGSLHSHDLFVQASLVDRTDVGWLEELRCILVDVHHCDMDCGTEKC